MEKAVDAVIAPWAQMGIIGAVVIALGIVVVMLWSRLEKANEGRLNCEREFGKLCLDITVKKIESDNKLADALEGLERVVDAAMGARKS